jgi:hypothetical protein
MYVDSGGSVGLWDVFDLNYDGSKIRLGKSYTFNSNNIANGILADGNQGILKMGAGTNSPNEGVFSSNGTTGITRMGPGDSFGIGVNVFQSAMFAGSGITNYYLSAPYYEPYSPNTFMRVVDENGNKWCIPMWQQVP